MTQVSVNSERLWDALMGMASIGAIPESGVCRIPLTAEDREARNLFASWCEAAGCTTRIDALGNIFARREGACRDLPPILVGSHLDTQPTGGRFDGVYGVLAALEVVRTLNDEGVQTQAPIEIVVWTNEESSRFSPPMLGSGVFVGRFSLDYALARTDEEGCTLGHALDSTGYRGIHPVGGFPIAAYLEAHIEQGPILEESNRRIGVVTGALGQRWYDVVISGVEAHAGTTPMDRRHDALAAAAFIIKELRSVGEAFAPHGRATVGYIRSYPNSRATIPGRVTFSVDLRHRCDADLDSMQGALRKVCVEADAQYGIHHEIKPVFSFPPVAFDQTLTDVVRQSCSARGYTKTEIESGAGHDAVYIAMEHPTAMIFIPSKGGVSHNPLEYSSPEDCAYGCNVLLDSILLIDSRTAQVKRR